MTSDVQQRRDELGANVVADLRALADVIDGQPVLGALLRDSLRGLAVFPHLAAVDADEIENALSVGAQIADDAGRSIPVLGAFEIRRAEFPYGGVAVRVYRRVDAEVTQ